MTTTSMLHVRMDEKTKAEAIAALAAMGLTAADAVRLLFHRIAADRAFPLELKVPNAETRAAMEEAEAIAFEQELRRERDATPLAARLGAIARKAGAMAGPHGRAMTKDEIDDLSGF
jgi:DNA-damage-inducible protein J